jgi:hypothetical protein
MRTRVVRRVAPAKIKVDGTYPSARRVWHLSDGFGAKSGKRQQLHEGQNSLDTFARHLCRRSACDAFYRAHCGANRSPALRTCARQSSSARNPESGSASYPESSTACNAKSGTTRYAESGATGHTKSRAAGHTQSGAAGHSKSSAADHAKSRAARHPKSDCAAADHRIAYGIAHPDDHPIAALEIA